MAYQFKTKSTNPNFTNVEDVPPQEVLDNSKELVLIDVREISEFHGELGHIPDAELIVLSTLPQQINLIPKDQTVVFICRSGNRSANAAAYAKSVGYNNVYNMIGGMILWNQLQFPTEK